MAILIRNATIVTMDDSDHVHSRHSLLIEDGRIAALGEHEELHRQYPQAEIVAGEGKAVFPGLANTHTHLPLVLARGIFEDLSPPHRPPFDGGIWPLPLPELDPDEQRTMCQLAAIEAIRSGTTAVLEDGTDIETYAEAIAASGLRLLLCERSWDRADAQVGDPSPFEQDRALGNRTLQKIVDLHSRWNGAANGRITVGIAAWAPDVCSPELLRQLRDLQEELDCVATIHLNQVWGEVAAIKAHRGRLPTEYLDETGFLSDRLICAHCRCMEPSEEQRLGSCGCSVAFNSAIAARRGLSPRIHDLEEYGCRIAMGTDNMSENMVDVIRTGLFMERVRREDGRQPIPEEALRWASTNGYKAMGIADGGSIEIGNRADLFLVDMERANLVPMLRPASAFVHQGQPADISAVMVDGQWLMRDGRILTLNEEEIVRDAQRIAEHAWAKLFESRPDLARPAGFLSPGVFDR